MFHPQPLIKALVLLYTLGLRGTVTHAAEGYDDRHAKWKGDQLRRGFNDRVETHLVRRPFSTAYKDRVLTIWSILEQAVNRVHFLDTSLPHSPREPGSRVVQIPKKARSSDNVQDRRSYQAHRKHPLWPRRDEIGMKGKMVWSVIRARGNNVTEPYSLPHSPQIFQSPYRSTWRK